MPYKDARISSNGNVGVSLRYFFSFRRSRERQQFGPQLGLGALEPVGGVAASPAAHAAHDPTVARKSWSRSQSEWITETSKQRIYVPYYAERARAYRRHSRHLLGTTHIAGCMGVASAANEFAITPIMNYINHLDLLMNEA